MNDQMTREHVAEIVYEVIHERADQMIRERMAAIVAEVTHEQVAEIVAAARAKTLADMTEQERDDCQWMQADTEHKGRVVILDPCWKDGSARLLCPSGFIDPNPTEWEKVTPRPDLPRMEWPGTGQDGEEVAKVDYVSVAGGRTAYGPWTVARLRKKADITPALPEGWRLADHPDYGRVIVTTPTPNRNGNMYFVLPVDNPMGHERNFCDPDRLTYIDQEADQ